MSELAPIALSVGCPCGIGPEIAVEAAARFPHPLVLIGDEAQLRELAARRGHDLSRHRLLQPGPPLAASGRQPGRPAPASGAAQLAWIDAALDLVQGGEARALTTGPVSKKVIASSGAPGAASFTGHTEHLQRRLGADEVIMAFWSPALSTSLATTHLPLREVPGALSPERVASAAFWLGWLLTRLGQEAPRIAVAGLNPHAGEGGLLGDEERRILEPGLEQAKERADRAGLAIRWQGVLGSETAFRQGASRGLDGVVAMYHDQATIPMKLLGFGEAVNVSLGLPVVRTSVDHGTGYDRAGTGAADARGLLLALELAHRMTAGPGATSLSGSLAGSPRMAR
ncbi:MAG: 4-hydroxythreonine-4-phosphate dehydrogenase PdxA [Polyangiaceae bacterium]|jgi:4-hydroxythreonine-4-phosphate dehydrogenase|nr:4-hydroxythreonine-4-phosphate dehydrogenase PdxA [Polyangiaceae bacterium]